MTTWLLILILISPNGEAIHHIAFSTESACIDARERIAAVKPQNTWGGGVPDYAGCVAVQDYIR